MGYQGWSCCSLMTEEPHELRWALQQSQGVLEKARALSTLCGYPWMSDTRQGMNIVLMFTICSLNTTNVKGKTQSAGNLSLQ